MKLSECVWAFKSMHLCIFDCASEYLYVCSMLVGVQGYIWYRCMYLVFCKGHKGFLYVCVCVCVNVQQKVNVVHVWLCRCVILEDSCLCCASIYASVLVSRKWSQRWWDTHICSNSYVQGYMHRHTCVPSTRLTLLLGPVKLRPIWHDLWYAGVQPGVHGHKCVRIPGLEPMENGGI